MLKCVQVFDYFQEPCSLLLHDFWVFEIFDLNKLCVLACKVLLDLTALFEFLLQVFVDWLHHFFEVRNLLDGKWESHRALSSIAFGNLELLVDCFKVLDVLRVFLLKLSLVLFESLLELVGIKSAQKGIHF